MIVTKDVFYDTLKKMDTYILLSSRKVGVNLSPRISQA